MAVAPHRQQQAGIAAGGFIISRRARFDRGARLRAQIAERVAQAQLFEEFAVHRLAVALRQFFADGVEAKALRHLVGVDQQQPVRLIGQRRQLDVVPERHIVVGALEALPIGVHPGEAGVQSIGKRKRDCSRHGRGLDEGAGAS
jgi:hypothetical protein